MSEEAVNPDELNPAVVCIVCHGDEVSLNHKFKTLLFGMGCEPHISDYQVAVDMGGAEFNPDMWLAEMQVVNDNVIGIVPDAPIAVEGVPNA